jgi:alanyl-tRNA synthetase
MSGNEIREKYLSFMAKRGHAIVPSAPLVPENDPTTLFTGSGMQPMLPYLMGEPHPKGTRIVDSQKCFRAEDIDQVGDNRHTTFFEMLGNWSFGDYFKKEQIEWMFEFLITEIDIDPRRLHITVFGGDQKNNLPRDEEAPIIWQNLFKQKGITAAIANIGNEAAGYERGMQDGERIFYYDASKNWWSRAGVPDKMPIGEPGGPDSEMFYDFGTPHDTKYGEHCHPNCDCGRFMEIGNNVFMQYVKRAEGQFQELAHKNIDFGGGLERIVAAALHSSQNIDDVFKTDLFTASIAQIERLSEKKYEEDLRAFRVIADHVRGAVFMIGDDIHPSNTEQGYFARRLLRRSVRYADVLGIPAGEFKNIAASVIETFKDVYTNLAEKKEDILRIIEEEEAQFRKTLEEGLKRFNKITLAVNVHTTRNPDGKITIDKSKRPEVRKIISGRHAFELFTTHGFPIELTEEIAAERGFEVDRKEFDKLMVGHREKSRAGSEHKFKGGLADSSERVVAYHTATHLLLAALRKELGNEVHQAGSNITVERLRFDFTYPEKVGAEALRRIEEYVNTAIKADAKVSVETVSKSKAEADPSIEGSFWEKYPDEVKVYTIKDATGTIYSRELCGGPHVENTGTISGSFRIVKEESSAAGIRRIRAVLE